MFNKNDIKVYCIKKNQNVALQTLFFREIILCSKLPRTFLVTAAAVLAICRQA